MPELSHRPQNPSIHFYCHKNRQKSIIFIAHTKKSIFQSILDLQRRKNPSIQSSFLSQRCKNPFISVAEVQKSRFHFCRTALKIHPSIWHTVSRILSGIDFFDPPCLGYSSDAPCPWRWRPLLFEYVHTPEGGWQTRDIQDSAVGSKWRFDMAEEVQLGLAPPEWSTTSQMKDPRPMGKSLFDARFCNSPMGRARGGYSMHIDARGIAQTKGETKAAENMDSNWFANDMADETAAGCNSAMLNQYGNNTNLESFQGADLMLAQMSARVHA